MSGPGNGGVVVTGAAGGVGFTYAGDFMDRWYDVVICDVRDCGAAAAALESRHPNGRVFHTKCDVSDKNAVEKLGKFAVDRIGPIEHWIKNAGVNGGNRALMDVPVEQVELVERVNLLGVLLASSPSPPSSPPREAPMAANGDRGTAGGGARAKAWERRGREEGDREHRAPSSKGRPPRGPGWRLGVGPAEACFGSGLQAGFLF